MTTKLFTAKAYLYARWLTYCLFLSLPFTRILSGLNLVVIIFIAWIFLFFHWNRKLLPTSLIWFTVIANCYFILSFFNIFPKIWTVEFEISAIPQQALFAYSMLPMFYLFFTFIVYFLHSDLRLKKLLKIILAFVVYNKCVDALLDGFEFDFFFSIAGLGNISALAILGFSLAISSSHSVKEKTIYILFFLLASVNSPFSQNIVFAFMFLWILFVPKYSIQIIGLFIFSTVLVYGAFLNDPMTVHFIDQNLTVRLVLIKDAIDGFLQSNTIGVGFGTESIQNYYPLFKNPVFQNEDEAGFLHITVHNSFATIAYRLGIAGFTAFIFFLYATLKCISDCRVNKSVASILFLCFYIVCFQNPALESYIYMIGVFLMFGSIWALNYVELLSSDRD